MTRRGAERMITVTGKVLADAEADAESAALGIKAQYGSASRVLAAQSMKSRNIGGGDGERTLELTFKFREALDSISYELKVDAKTNLKSGNVSTVYLGTVHAGSAATAVQVTRRRAMAKRPFWYASEQDVAPATTWAGRFSCAWISPTNTRPVRAKWR